MARLNEYEARELQDAIEDKLGIFGRECVENGDFGSRDQRGYAEDIMDEVEKVYEAAGTKGSPCCGWPIGQDGRCTKPNCREVVV